VKVITQREHQVAALVADGKPNKAIAAELDITERTVRFHITSIYQKIGGKGRPRVAVARFVWVVRTPYI
jgi:DNA-binding CsgD family transcriptional regulator